MKSIHKTRSNRLERRAIEIEWGGDIALLTQGGRGGDDAIQAALGLELMGYLSR